MPGRKQQEKRKPDADYGRQRGNRRERLSNSDVPLESSAVATGSSISPHQPNPVFPNWYPDSYFPGAGQGPPQHVGWQWNSQQGYPSGYVPFRPPSGYPFGFNPTYYGNPLEGFGSITPQSSAFTASASYAHQTNSNNNNNSSPLGFTVPAPTATRGGNHLRSPRVEAEALQGTSGPSRTRSSVGRTSRPYRRPGEGTGPVSRDFQENVPILCRNRNCCLRNGFLCSQVQPVPAGSGQPTPNLNVPNNNEEGNAPSGSSGPGLIENTSNSHSEESNGSSTALQRQEGIVQPQATSSSDPPVIEQNSPQGAGKARGLKGRRELSDLATLLQDLEQLKGRRAGLEGLLGFLQANSARDLMRMAQDAMERSSPEDSGDQVLDLRKSTSEKLCVWCGKKSSVGEDSEFCSEVCFDQFRRDSFKKRAACMWCNNANHGMINLSLISSLDESKFCSDHCLTQFKVRLFCEETSAHLEQLKEIQAQGVQRNNASVPPVKPPPLNALKELITPELWLKKQSSQPNSKKGSPGGNLSSPNPTLSSGGDSAGCSPQSSQHSISPNPNTIVPNPNYNPQRLAPQAQSQISAPAPKTGSANSTASNSSGGVVNGHRRRGGALTPPPEQNPREVTGPNRDRANRQSLASQRKRMKSSSATVPGSSTARGPQLGGHHLQQHLLMTSVSPSHGIANNGNNNGALGGMSRSSSRRSNASSTMTSATQPLASPQIQVTGSGLSPRIGPFMNMNGSHGMGSLTQPELLARFMLGNRVPNQPGPSNLMGFNLPSENGFSAPNHHPFLGNPMSFQAQVPFPHSIRPQSFSGNHTVSTQTEDRGDQSVKQDDNNNVNNISSNINGNNPSNNGLANWMSQTPFMSGMIFVPFPIPIPIPIPILFGGQTESEKTATVDSPRQNDIASNVKNEDVENKIEESEGDDTLETPEEQCGSPGTRDLETPSGDGTDMPSDTKKD